jgi:DNA-binding TFAR19-related protein (PDSD5 family)
LQLVEGSRNERNDIDKNMLTMFNILRKNRLVKLENLVLNRNSFAQTVENLFTLSFLVRDGRAEIKVDKAGCHLICEPL